MSDIPGDLRYLPSHEWARKEDDGNVRVGISDHAQSQLGDLVYVELPQIGDRVEKEAACAVVESVKAASDVYSPISGEVVEVNETLADSPEMVNDSPYEDGWLLLVKPDDDSELEDLLDPDAYSASLDDE